MGDLAFIENLGIMIVTAAVVVTGARWLNMPTIVAYIVTGLLLAPMLGMLAMKQQVAAAPGSEVDHAIDFVSEAGIALLLFLVGLELSLEKIRDVGKVAIVAGIGQVVFTALGGFVLTLVLGFTVMESIFLATALTFSSTVVVVKLLDQKKELDSLYGRIAVGIFLVQDLVVIVVLTFLAGLGSPESFQPATMVVNLFKAFGGMGLLLVVALLASKYVLPRPFAWAAQSPPTLFIWSLCWCFLFVQAADWMQLSKEIGAFLAGMSLAQLQCSHQLRQRVHPLMNFFIMIFFITLGSQMTPGDALKHWQPAIWLSVFVLIGNPLIFMFIIARFGYSERTSFLTSVTVAQISEFSFIFAAVGLNAGLIDASVLSLITVVGLVTIGASAYMILYSQGLYDWVRRRGLLKVFKAGQTPEDESQGSERLDGHVIIVGMNALGRRIACLLHERGETVLAIDTDLRKIADLPCRSMVGNVDDMTTLEHAGFIRAKLGISTLQIEDANNLFAFRCKQFGIAVAIHAFDASVHDDLNRLGVDYLIDARKAGSDQLHHMLSELQTSRGPIVQGNIAATANGGGPTA